MKYKSAYSPVDINNDQRLVENNKKMNLIGKRILREDLIITKLLRKNI